VELESQGSVMGFPEERTTIVGTPVDEMAFMSGVWAPIKFRSLTSTCSPVLGLGFVC
jgi:hypothetical protein